MSRKGGVPEDKIQALERYAEHPGYTERERVALAWAEMITISPNDISDEQFADMKRHFTDRQIVEISVQASFEGFRARVNRALRIEDDGFAQMPVDKLPKALTPR